MKQNQIISAWLVVGALLVAATVADDVVLNDAQEKSKQRMAEMTSMIDEVSIEVEMDGEMHEAKRQPKALLRSIDLTRGSSRNEDGSLWLWSLDGVPVALVELHARNDSHVWGHTMLAVSRNRMKGVAKSNQWRPQRGTGVSFEPVPKTEKPHKKGFGRKVQMRNIARRIKTNIEDPGQQDKQQFRLMPEPIYRYQGREIQDGAIFAFVRGASNPEALLFVQSREDKWEYGFLRCSSNELVAQLDNDEVWRAGQVPGWVGSSDSPFWVFHSRYNAKLR